MPITHEQELLERVTASSELSPEDVLAISVGYDGENGMELRVYLTEEGHRIHSEMGEVEWGLATILSRDPSQDATESIVMTSTAELIADIAAGKGGLTLQMIEGGANPELIMLFKQSKIQPNYIAAYVSAKTA